MIVVVDDLRRFPMPATYARTSAAGVTLLADLHAQRTTITELWLDHDLGTLPDGTIDDIWPVVDWICERCVWDDPPAIDTIVIHTANPVGAQRIERGLTRWYRTRRVDAGDHGGIADPAFDQPH